ncbi:MAG TPA: hypothetical protein VND90_06915 [Terracidiphilus sp.]|nr:hypothetical protein [Terracidiphilus sp.]
MRQVVHIFAKDVRQHWPEILASLAVLTLYGWTAAYRPRARLNPEFDLRRLEFILMLLAPVSWWVMMTRVIQSESLVGHVQWWVTKPYEWGKLLAAKVVFAALFVVLPVMLLQAWLLKTAGFNPTAHLGGLGTNLALLVGAVLIPLAALAAVTSNFARMSLTSLVVLVVVVLGAVAIRYVQSGRYATDWPQYLAFALMLALAATAVVLQYARRREWRSRGLLISALVLWLAGVLVSATTNAIARTYPADAPKLSVKLTPTNPLLAYAAAIRPHWVNLYLLLSMSGVPEGRGVVVQAIQPTVIAADGRQWQGEWQPLGGQRFIGRYAYGNVRILVNREFYDAVRSEPVTLRLRLAAINVEGTPTVRMQMPGHNFAVSGFGNCSPVLDPMGRGYLWLNCRSAMWKPQLTWVTAQWSDTPCDKGGPDTTGVTGDAWVGELFPEPGAAGLNPVIDVPVRLSNPPVPPKSLTAGQTAVFIAGAPPRYLCAGTPLTFTAYRPTGRTQYSATLTDIRLPVEWDENHPRRQ